MGFCKSNVIVWVIKGVYMRRIYQIANGINSRSKNFEIGKLQELRTKIKKLNRQPGEKIFWNNTIRDGYAFHYGGRKELQYNIGKIDKDYRHGVAFSLERSQSLPDVTILYPKIERFNEYMSEFSEKYSDMMLWIRDENGYSHYKAGQINRNFVHQGVFHFFRTLVHFYPHARWIVADAYRVVSLHGRPIKLSAVHASGELVRDQGPGHHGEGYRDAQRIHDHR